MAVDIQGFDIVFSAANANHARTIDQSIANMEKNMGSLKQSSAAFADTMERLGRLDISKLAKDMAAIKDAVNGIDKDRLKQVFAAGTTETQNMLTNITEMINKLAQAGGIKIAPVVKPSSAPSSNSQTSNATHVKDDALSEGKINSLWIERAKLMKEIGILQQKSIALQAEGRSLSASENDALSKKVARLKTVVDTLEKQKQVNAEIFNKTSEKGELRLAESKVAIEKWVTSEKEKEERRRTAIQKEEERKRQQSIRESQREYNRQAEMWRAANNNKNTTLTGAVDFAGTANTLNRLVTAQKYLKEALASTKPNTPEWQRAADTYKQVTQRINEIKQAMGGVKQQTNSIIPSLQNLAMQFGLVFSVQQLNQWVKHMVEVRAQFELQNIALRSIIQNKEKADQIFAEVQQLALKSPFSIMQLNTYTKQMAAYGVEADKLVGVTKQLADVSAGLGVDMGRLILAYGQVKTANYLRATEVRQFTEAGLNITQELANYFTELNGKMVTAGDVTEMITKRMVKFEDVAEVFKRVTSAGGMFYEMQEKQSEGLQGQIQRIGDAYSIMLNDIGKSNQEKIAGVLATIRELIQNWRDVAEYIKMAARAYLLYEAYVHRATIIKVVTSLANAWGTVTKAIHASTAATVLSEFKTTGALGKLCMIADGVTTVVRGLGLAIKAAFNATIIYAVVSAVFSIINYFVEANAKADQLAESLDNIDQEVSKEFDQSAAAYERLARAITDSSKTFDERNEAMEELKRTFKDILPDEYLQLSYIEQYAGHWDAAEKSMKQYYDSLALEKEKAAIKDANEPDIKETRNDIVELTNENLGEDFGISKGQLQSFVDNILQQMLDGSITTTEHAIEEYIRQIEDWNNKILSDRARRNLKADLKTTDWSIRSKESMSDLLETAKEIREEYDALEERQNHYGSASEKANTEAQKMMETQAEGVKSLIERVKSGLDQINAIKGQLSQVELEEQNEETQARKLELQNQLNQAIQQQKDLYEAIGIDAPNDLNQVTETVIGIREETARASEEIVKRFGDGINPAVVDLYESYQKLAKVQSQLNDGTQRSKEEHDNLADAEKRLIKDIESKYRQMGIHAQGDIKRIASSQQSIYTEMVQVCDATRNYFKKQLAEKLFGYIKTLGTTIEKFLGSIGIEVKIVDWDKLEAELKKNGGDYGKLLQGNVNYSVNKILKANEQVLKSTLNLNDKIIASDDRLSLKQGQSVNDYVKNLKTMYEENEKVIYQYDKAKDKNQWLRINNMNDSKIKQLREQAMAAKEIAELYDPTIFESNKKGGRKRSRNSGRKGTDNTEEIARKRFEFFKRANTEYEKLLKNYDAETAKAKILSDMMGEARTLGVDKQFAKDLFTKASTLETLQEVYDTFYRGIVAKYPKIAMDFQKTFNGISLEVDVKLREEDRNTVKKQMDELIGGYELAIELDKSGIDRDIISQLFGVETFDLSDVTAGIEKAWLDVLNARAKRAAEATGDEFKAYKSFEEAKAAMGEEDVKLFESQQKKISDTFAKELRAREKEYAKYLKKSYSESVNEQVRVYRQLRQLQIDADFKRNAINRNENLNAEEKLAALQQIDAQMAQIAARMQEELQKNLSKIQWESFKDSPLFETILSDIEHLSTGAIDMLIKKFEQLKETYKGLDPKIIKEITKYIDQLTNQKITKNPFKEWGKALREINALKKQGLTLDKLNEKLISESNELEMLTAQADSYNKVLAIQQQMTHVTEQDVDLMQKDTKSLHQLLTSLESQKQASAGSDIDTKNLDLQIQKIQEIIAARNTILQSHNGNVALSQQELALLKKGSKELTNQILLLASYKGLKEGNIKDINAYIRSWYNLEDAQQKSIAILNEVGAAASAGFSVAEEALNLFGDSSDEVTKSMLQGFNDCLQACISLTTSIVAMGEAANTASGIIGIIAAALTAVASVFKAIFNVHEAKLEKSIKEHQRQVKKLEAEYDNLSDAISNAFSGFQLGTNTQEAIQNLEKQNEQYRAMIENEKEKKKSDKDQIADWEQTIEDNLKKAEELRQQYLTELGGLGSGSDVRDAAEGFVDAWADAFGETSDGISGLKKQFNDFMKNIVKKQAYMKIADHWINKFGDMINASFDEYGQVNYEKLQQAMQWFTEEAMPQMDTALEDMNGFWERMGISLTGTTSNLSGLAAGIQGVTEETAQILEALLNSMRYYVADTNEQLRQIFVTMTNPNEENPFLKELKNQTKYLASIDKRLDSVISATKRASGSHINVFTT